MELKNAVVFITGANRGLGLTFAREALARSARKVYAAARDPSGITLEGVVPVKLDVTRAEDVAAAAEQAGDVTLVINNAGIAEMGGFLAPGSVASVRRHLDVNVFGPLLVAQAFAPVLAANGGGAMLNVLSIASWTNNPVLGAYGLSKSAAWALTNGLRHELRGQGTQVLGLHMGFVDTEMTKDIDAPKSTPQAIVAQALDALEAGDEEVLADERTRQVKQGLSANPAVYL
ncbi:SDR family oxidoreductase [Achromobacter sp. MFA1 R4]|uniref:SDR family oxidoreductase n=1 Tax=Achromobacter sp. MFA1 R4 TaxID=1881016 RepID=UPI0009537646|nr:SDR family oxidoreductase [Achromobacter sp. MFA1 R4]SIT32557.1 Short-chain dehydrogenase [Achromobacter sp. MFA1 R4]